MIEVKELRIGNLITYESADGMDLNIKYVHQLQNLYFSLTGEELEIK